MFVDSGDIHAQGAHRGVNERDYAVFGFQLIKIGREIINLRGHGPDHLICNAREVTFDEHHRYDQLCGQNRNCQNKACAGKKTFGQD